VSVFTVFGARGFIGSALVHHLRRTGHAVRVAEPDGEWQKRPLGHVIYAVGLTADFRRRPVELGDAHVGLCSRILKEAGFESFMYLSSARLYQSSSLGREDAAFIVDPQDSNQVYDLSKLAGESLCLHSGRPGTRVVRLSNVVGAGDRSENFLTEVIGDSVKGHVTLRTSGESSKDYVLLDDVVRVLPEIAMRGTQRIYNVASGTQITHREIMERVQGLTNCTWDIDPSAQSLETVPVDIGRVQQEFGFRPTPVLDRIEALVAEHAIAAATPKSVKAPPQKAPVA